MDSKVDYQALLKDKKHTWQVSNPPAEPSVIRQLRNKFRVKLPDDYLEFFAFSNGAFAEIPVYPKFCDLFMAEDILGYESDYQMARYFPGYVAIGSSGDGDVIALKADSAPYPVKSIIKPYSGAPDELMPVADSFQEFVCMFGTGTQQKQE